MQHRDVKPLIIYGCGGHARSVADIAISNGIKNIIFVDKNAKANEKLLGFDILKDIPAFGPENYFIALGDNDERAKLWHQLSNENKNIVNLISQNAYIGNNVHLQTGIFVGNAVHIGPNVTIGIGTIINTRSVIEHDCVVGAYSHVSVNAVMAGKSQIGDFVFMGAGSILIDDRQICSHVMIGAGSVVVNDIVEPGTYVGVPARKIR